MRVAELNVATLVVQPVEVAISQDPADTTSMSVPIPTTTAATVIDSLPTVNVRELVVIAQSDQNMNLTVNIVSIGGATELGIDNYTVTTLYCPANTPSRVVVTGLGFSVQIQAALYDSSTAAGRITVLAIGRP